MDIDGKKIFKSIQQNSGAHYDADDWTLVDWLPSEESCGEVFAWLKENNICYIVTGRVSPITGAGFLFWEPEDAVAFKLRWL